MDGKQAPRTENISSRRRSAIMVFLGLVFLFFTLFSSFAHGFEIGLNYRNVSVDTTVNITNAAPEIVAIFIDDPITLTAGSTYDLVVNISVRDYNGFADIDSVNATFWTSPSMFDANDNNNTHYHNVSCAQDFASGYFANYSCTFSMLYYAYNGTWNITSLVNDTKGFKGNGSNGTTVNPLFALNVTSLIDYGQLAVEDTSANRTANVTNYGNVPINVSVYGYGAVGGDGLAMVCEFGSIPIGMQKFAANDTALFDDKINLSNTAQNIPGFVITNQEDPALQITNTTYWQLYVPPNPFGICNGTVVFQAEEYTE